MVLADAQLGPLQCSLFSAGCLCLVGMVLAEGSGSLGGQELGNVPFRPGMNTFPCDPGKVLDPRCMAGA